MKTLRIILAQLNFRVGDLEGNLKRHLHAAKKARDELAADLIIFPELSITGYPPEDLLLKTSFIKEAEQAVRYFIEHIEGIHCLIGHPQRTEKGLYNAATLAYQHAVLGQHAKLHLPNYGVFDEKRYFLAGHTAPCIIPIKGILISFIICEDLWFPGPIKQAAEHGAHLLLCINASPFEIDKHEQRVALLASQSKTFNMPLFYVNQVGAQDELVFDGGSLVTDETGRIVQSAGFFNETLLPVEITFSTPFLSFPHQEIAPLLTKEARIYQALTLGLKDYVEKNNFQSVLVGVSGGIDSALTLAIAVDALGKERVRAVCMPSRHTTQLSLEEADLLTKNLGIDCDVISIEPVYQTFLDALHPYFAGKKSDITEENLQARCRAVILMALSNKHHHLVLVTSNRSELAMGYGTLYGDMAGGYAVLKDVLKTQVYTLAKYRNTLSPVIPQRTIERPPTAELAPGQKDSDTLPMYEILDPILELYLDQGLSAEEIIAKGGEKELVLSLIKKIHQNEYKRQQAAKGTRIHKMAFGKDWRYPITNGYTK